MPELPEDFSSFLNDTANNIIENFKSRWDQVTPDIYQNHTHEVIGGLLARQVELSLEIIFAPYLWNQTITPLITRSMIDLHINLAWILIAPDKRAKLYVEYGWGQQKLHIEHLRRYASEESDQEQANHLENIASVSEEWLNSQAAMWSINVDVGAWSGKPTRIMAQETGLEKLYNLSFVPMSSVAHNAWHHISIFNLKTCKNPMHKFHKTPSYKKSQFVFDQIFAITNHLSATFELFDGTMETSTESLLPYDFVCQHPYVTSEDDEQEASMDGLSD